MATARFLEATRRTAIGRFDAPRLLFRNCTTVQCTIPNHWGEPAPTGAIVAHVGAPLLKAWIAAAPGSLAQRRAHVMAQLAMVLQDLADHDAHMQVTLTDAQREAYEEDLVQLVEESLSRTTFPYLGRTSTVHWEGTMVRSMQPPFLVLVLSIG